MLTAVLIFGALIAPVVPHHAAPVVHHPVHHATVKPKPRHKHKFHHSPAYFALAHEKHVQHLEHLRQVYLREQAAQYVPPVHHRYKSQGSYSSWSASTPSASNSHNYTANSQSSTYHGKSGGTSSGYGGSITDIPGVPKSFVACVAYRESTNGQNTAYNGGTYGIISASGYNVNGQSLSAQKQAFKKIYDTTGGSAWAADGCPGT